MFLGALLRIGVGDLPVKVLLFSAGSIGVLLSASWYIVIRSYRQLNSGKFQALHELEKKLTYPFFTQEWDLLAKGRDRSRYWRPTTVEVGLPCIFFVLFCGLVVCHSCAESSTGLGT